MSRKSFRVTLIVCRALIVLVGTLSSSSILADPWVDFFGSHYREEDWGGAVRDPVQAGSLGHLYTDKEILIIKKYTKNKDIIAGVGGLGSARNIEAVDFFLTRMLLDFGVGWKSELAANIKKLKDANLTEDKVYWQFGNEINSPSYSKNIHTWVGNSGASKGHDVDIIPYYIEMFLAPGVEAIRSAEKGKKTVQVVLGSVSSYANPDAQKFLKKLMSYKVNGLLAPKLKGKLVSELIDVVSLHYVATSNDGDWRQALDDVKDQWLDSGEIDAVWSTEELGVQRARINAGSVFTNLVVARYLNWWLESGMTSEEGRAFFWGSNMGKDGHRGRDALTHLLNDLGRNAELNITPTKYYSISGDNLEHYSFSESVGNKHVIFVAPNNQRQAAEIKYFNLDSLGVITGARLYSTNGNDMLGRNIKGRTILDESISLPAKSILVLIVES